MSETCHPPLDDVSIAQLRAAIVAVVTRDLGYTSETAHELSRDVSDLLRLSGLRAWPRISRRLRHDGVQARWNEVLASHRSADLAAWILGHCKSPVLDLLCGNGLIGEQLGAFGLDVVLAERCDAYAVPRRHGMLYLDIAGLDVSALRRRQFNTVVLCTVLHHEADPEWLLHVAAALARKRLIIVENCLDRHVSQNGQSLLDLFFSQGLNNFESPALGNHRTAEAWLALASQYGAIVAHERTSCVPGIPLSHDLIVIDRGGTEAHA